MVTLHTLLEVPEEARTLRTQSVAFARSVINAVRTMRNSKIEAILTNQLLRCGTSIGANVHNALLLQGPRDYISSMKTAVRECNECEYWLTLLKETDSISETDFQCLMTQEAELRGMLLTAIDAVRSGQNG